MRYKDIDGNWKELSIKASDTLAIGSIIPFGGTKAPTNWLICDGSQVSRVTYAELFNIIGTKFGEGDGSTTFNLPDLRGKVITGLDASQDEFNVIGKTGGEKTHTLTTEEMPAHNHEITWGSYNPSFNSGGGNLKIGYDDFSGDEIDLLNSTNTGGNQAHNNMQPYVTTNYIIKAFQSVGVVGNVVNEKTTSDKDTYSCDYINNQLLNIEKGSVTVYTENTDYVEVAVTFNKTFNSRPTIILTPESAGIGFNAPTVAIKKNSISTTGFTMIYTSGYSSGYTNKVYYLAIE